jgi:hypothetical protein
MKKFWLFVREKENREVFSWLGGGCVAVGSLAFGALNFFMPNEAVDATAASVTPIAGIQRCASLDDIITISNGFVLPHSSERKLQLAELATLSSCQKWIARNEIFARKGRPFDNDILDVHFRQQAWYQIQIPHSDLTDIEQANVDAIKALED